MAIRFNSSERTTLGVEWELQLVDSATRHLRQEAQQLLGRLPELSQGNHPPLRHELMQCTVEVVTGICETVEEARTDLARTIERLQQATDPSGIGLICSGTHPLDDWRDQTLSPVQRYGELIEQMQWLARRILTFGVHVHVGVSSQDRAIPIVNALANYLPHFLALTASSPFWSGHDTGLASSRSIVFGALPTAGPPPRLPHWGAFEEYMETLLRAGTIASIKEVWWDVRPHPDFGTVEIRMFDGIPTLREVGMAAALSQSLVQLFEQQLDRGYSLPSPPTWVVTDNKWRATRYGLDARVITDERGSTAPLRDDLYELVRELKPVAARLGCAAELDVVSETLSNGASYERQRAIIEQGGTLNDVVDALSVEFRDGAPGAALGPLPAAGAGGAQPEADHDRTDPSRKRGPSHAGT
ncbi:glutamate--cysteine ligase [Nocardiopsis ansamitocini]|uniref:Putative glutamate--cysteine ligase 2 n=1 Tax=Nocardiopsis ansamitocini TaxID=1670832 RepID=A0A9W6P9Q6_9ACTN|nr:glutamate--cysteine ligase [Nocardiopsis ansamitocini]GLU49567.1 putative glutamate--cysteine ligase 2 [Nocardiopsis ansamitocini]